MNEKMWIFSILGGLMIIIGLVFGITWVSRVNDLAVDKVLAPKQEQIRRETFEESKAYNEGVAQEIYSMQMEYVRSNPEQKLALRSIILHRTAGYDLNKFPPDLRQFISTLKSEVTK